MTSTVIEPLMGRLRWRRSLVDSEAQRIAPTHRPAPVARWIDSLDAALDSLLSLEPGSGCAEPLDAVGRALRLQHEALREHASTLDALLEVMAEVEPPAGHPVSAQVLLADFARELGDHLAFEESSGCMERAAEAELRFARKVGGLLEEHAAFRRQVAGLAADAAEARSGSSDWEPVRDGFRALCEALRRHEAAEAEVLFEAHQLDLGGSG